MSLPSHQWARSSAALPPYQGALLTGIVGSAFASQMAKRKAIFEAEVQDALADGVLSEDEARRIEKLRREFSLSEEHAIAIIRSISDQKRS